MTKENIIDNIARLNSETWRDREEVRTEIGKLLSELKKALEQPTTQEILSHIETGITATGQSDSYSVGFCNALVWLKSCITHEEPQFFEDKGVRNEMTKEENIKNLKKIKTVGLCKQYLNTIDEVIKSLEQQPCEDCVSRAEVIKSIQSDINISFEGQRALEKYAEDIKLIIWCLLDEQEKKIKALPPVTPIHGTCKDCKHWDKDDKYCKHLSNEYGWLEDDDYRVDTEEDFYCADFEKRGNEDDSN